MRFVGGKTRWETMQIGGRTAIVPAGTINKKPDKDDAWWYALALNHDVIFDIGCNVGTSSLMACWQQPSKTILLADPNPRALQVAAECLECNGMAANKTYICAFVGAQAGEEVKFYSLGTGSAGSMFGSHADSAKAVNAHYRVPTTTLDAIVAERQLLPTLVKIDVEAAESYVLQGATALATHRQTVFIVEMHGPAEMPMERNAALVLDWCNGHGYTAYYMKEHIPLQSPGQIAHRGRCHLLLLPDDMHYPAYLEDIREGDEVWW